MNISPEEQLVLSAFKLNPDLKAINHLNECVSEVKNWDLFLQILTDRGVAPLFYKTLPVLSRAAMIPEAVKAGVKNAYFRTLSRSMLLYAHFKELSIAFEKEGMEFIPLKGSYLSEKLYQDVALRQFSDMDLLFRAEDGPRALEILKTIGYRQSEDHQSELIKTFMEVIHYMPMVKGEVSVEVHIKLHTNKESYYLDPLKFWEKAGYDILNGCKVRSLDYYDMLIHVAIHLDKHFQKSSLQFTCYLDLINLIENRPVDFNWHNFISRCEEFNCKNEVFLHVVIAVKYMNLNLSEEIYSPYMNLMTPKMQKLFINHLRGKSVKSEATNSHLENIKKLSLPQQIKYLFEAVFPNKKFMYNTYKIKHPALLPFFYPYRIWIGIKGLVRNILK